MIHKFIMPKLGWTMENGKIIKWLKSEGDLVEKGEELLAIETAKVTIKVEAPESGILQRILYKEGETIPVNRTIALIIEPGIEITDDEVKDFILKIKQEEGDGLDQDRNVKIKKDRQLSRLTRPALKLLASPKARKLARERNIDLNEIRGTGPDGVILARDVEMFEKELKTAKMPRLFQYPHDGRLTILNEHEIAGIRKVIAERMFNSLKNSAQLTITKEINVDALVEFRNIINKKMKNEGRKLKISYTDIIALVVSEVLSKHRKFNASFDGKVLKIFDEINLGIATATDRGLIVPVLWNANKYSLFKLSIKINELSKGARKGNISLDNLSGSTFTISNLGMFGIGAFTPIVNPPEIAILGVGEISIRPSYHQDRIKPAHTMILSLSFDHQVIDGHEAAIFLNSIANYLESFERLFDLHEMRLRRAKEKLMFEQLSDTEADYDVVILGSGPAANDAVLNLAGFDLKIAIIESEHLGGTCLNEGCVPLKKMFEIADLRRKMVFLEDEGSITLDGQFKIDYDAFISQRIENTKEIRNSMARHYTEMGISLINGVASFRDEHSLQVTNTDGSSKIITFKKAIIATGSDYIPLKDNDGTLLMDAKHFLNSKHYPSSIAFFGEDKINLELASCLSHLGVEDLYILIPHELDLHGFDEDFVNAIVELLELNNIEIYQHVSIKSIEKTQNNNYLIRFFDENEKEETIQVELIVNGGAKKPRLDNLKLSNAGIKVDESGNLILNNGYQTSNPDVFAIGDV
ncbi:MAG: 2-oxo acid dehydrogenase subunit E2, partial [Promethearchaeota archaeon]